MKTETTVVTAGSPSGDPVLDWLRQLPPLVEQLPSEELEAPTGIDAGARSVGADAHRTRQVAVPATVTPGPRLVRAEIHHRRHRDHPTWEIPTIPEDLFPLRAAGMLGLSVQHRPICAIVDALRPGDTARIRSDHPVGPLCHAVEDRCAAQVDLQLEHEGPDEWTVLLTRR